MMFFLLDEDGRVTGPHSDGVVRRRLEAGEMTWEYLVCAQGTEDWVPAHVYEDVIDQKGQERREAQVRERRMRAALMMPEKRQGGGPVWQAACAFFMLTVVMGIGGGLAKMPALVVLGAVPALACFVCGVVLAVQGYVVRGVVAVGLTVLVWPVVWWGPVWVVAR